MSSTTRIQLSCTSFLRKRSASRSSCHDVRCCTHNTFACRGSRHSDQGMECGRSVVTQDGTMVSEMEGRSLQTGLGIVGLRDGQKRSGWRDFLDGITVGNAVKSTVGASMTLLLLLLTRHQSAEQFTGTHCNPKAPSRLTQDVAMLMV